MIEIDTRTLKTASQYATVGAIAIVGIPIWILMGVLALVGLWAEDIIK